MLLAPRRQGGGVRQRVRSGGARRWHRHPGACATSEQRHVSSALAHQHPIAPLAPRCCSHGPIERSFALRLASTPAAQAHASSEPVLVAMTLRYGLPPWRAAALGAACDDFGEWESSAFLWFEEAQTWACFPGEGTTHARAARLTILSATARPRPPCTSCTSHTSCTSQTRPSLPCAPCLPLSR